MDHEYHLSIKHFIFGENMTNKDITSLLIKIGWGYTLFFVGTAFVRKIFGAQSCAPYGKFLDSSYLTGTDILCKVFLTPN